jgi:hypothetical protein
LKAKTTEGDGDMGEEPRDGAGAYKVWLVQRDVGKETGGCAVEAGDEGRCPVVGVNGVYGRMGTEEDVSGQ